MRPLVIAHRGFSGAAPENTLPSFRKALRAGADGLEFDLRLTLEGRVVIIHDAKVDRTTDGIGRVRRFTMGGIRRLDAGSWFDRPFRRAKVPMLEEVLRLGRNCGVLILDTKDLGTDWIADHAGELKGRPCFIASEFDSFLRSVKRRYPWAKTALTAEKKGDLARAVKLGCSAIDPRSRLVDTQFMRRARKSGLAVYPWTVNQPKEAVRLARLGVDGVITNFPGPVREALRKHGGSFLRTARAMKLEGSADWSERLKRRRG